MARSPQTRKDARVNRVREYFYGPSGDLQPHAQTVAAEQLQVFKIGEWKANNEWDFWLGLQGTIL